MRGILGFFFSFFILLTTGAAEKPAGLLDDPDWVTRIRPDHPRLFLNADTLPVIRERARTVCAKEFEAIKKQVDELPDDAPEILLENPVRRNADGSLAVKPGQQGHTLFKYNGGDQAMKCALVYLVTGDEKYAVKAQKYLQLTVKVMQWTAENNIWMDLTGQVRINALAAYDWIYDTLTPQQRKEFLLPFLDYLTDSQPEGRYKFRRTIGGPADGNYGERALMYFAGLAGYGNGVDDVKSEDFLRRGAKLFVDMMDHRDRVSAGSGVLSALTGAYSFGAYPYATFFFLHSWQSAFNEDISARWEQMADYPNWFDFFVIRRGKDRDFLSFGIGDFEHTTNEFHGGLMYTHLAQAIHFYGEKYPDKALQAYATLAEIRARRRVFSHAHPFIGFLVTKFEPAKIEEAAKMQLKEPPYFYNSSFGLLMARSGRGEHDTYFAFRMGSRYANHQHYDELSFIIYKDGFLALDAGSRTETDHHHNFAPQSVAHNTILIHQENEPMPEFWKSWSHKPDGKIYYNHGGQNDRTKANRLALKADDGYLYAAADATKSYASTKSREVVRQIVYVKPDYFIVYDRVTSVKAKQRKEFLLHFQNQPEKIADHVFQADNGGRLFVTTLLPARPQFELIGGPGKEFFASGRNWELDGGDDWDKKYQATGKWRLEVSDTELEASARFLHFLQAAEPESDARVKCEYLSRPGQDGLRFTDRAGQTWEIFFNRTGEVNCQVTRI